MPKKLAPKPLKPPKPIKPKPFLAKNTYTCPECEKSFTFELDAIEHGKLVARIGSSTPIRVKCPHCTTNAVIHGKGKSSKRTKRSDWDELTMGKKPWEDVPRKPVNQ